jgi:ClpP class serine protease
MQSDEIKKIESKLNMVIDSKMALEINAVDHYTNDIVIDSAGVGTVIVSGVLMPEPNELLDYFSVNYTAYSDIVNQINALEGDKTVKSILLKINSPGGDIVGMYNAMSVIAGTDKPITAQTTGMAASAAYMLASQTDDIGSSDELTLIGSVGVVIDHFVSDNFVSVTNTKSEKKRNDVTTPEGVKNEKEELDDIYNVLVEKIAEGRGVTVEAINQNYGQGAIMTARTALKNGMIDAIGIIKPAEQTAITEETRAMDKALLKAEHPELYSAILAEGNEAGKVEVNTLTQAHLVLADASGDMERALSDIKAGVLVDAAVMAHHTAQGIKKAQIVAHGDEAPVVPETSDEVEVDADKELEKEMNAIDGLEVTL